MGNRVGLRVRAVFPNVTNGKMYAAFSTCLDSNIAGFIVSKEGEVEVAKAVVDKVAVSISSAYQGAFVVGSLIGADVVNVVFVVVVVVDVVTGAGSSSSSIISSSSSAFGTSTVDVSIKGVVVSSFTGVSITTLGESSETPSSTISSSFTSF